MTELEHAIKHIKTRADAWAVKEVTEALQRIAERMDKALSQEPSEDMTTAYLMGYYADKEPCDDAISRDMALEKMADYVASGYADSVEDFEEYSRIICQLPPVTHKSGKWILLDECANSGYYCSNCQKKLVKEGWSQTVKKIKYCPNCGARMESEE